MQLRRAGGTFVVAFAGEPMIARRKSAFLKLCSLLRQIEADPKNLSAVKKLNLGLLKEILRDEENIRRYKERLTQLNRQLKTERPSKVEANSIRKKLKIANARLIDTQINCSFGDASVTGWLTPILKPFTSNIHISSLLRTSQKSDPVLSPERVG